MFVDELELYAKAGDGGHGVVRWRSMKFRPKAGPSGGNGGNGGHVFMRAVRDTNRLAKYTGNKEFYADDGEAGRKNSEHGKGAEDMYIDIPVGSTVIDLDRDRTYTLFTEGETVEVLKGGRGGLGNEHFKSSTNRTPTESTEGTPGEEGRFKIEVAVIADVGLVGLPNAGKSTLLNAFTNATSAIGSYPFTTTEPHLGALYEFVVADIPGLIDGAAAGKGLGHKFLRHVMRTSMLLHLVSLENEDPLAVYREIRQELESYDEALAAKEEWIVLTKVDTSIEEIYEEVVKECEALGRPVYVISATTGEGVKELRDALVAHLRTG